MYVYIILVRIFDFKSALKCKINVSVEIILFIDDFSDDKSQPFNNANSKI